MERFEPSTYGDHVAPVFDDWESEFVAGEDQLRFLKNLAGKGPALELGIGTGRVALPLLEKGVRVEGIDASRAMVARLREKPRGRELRVKLGNMARVDMGTRYPLVYVVFNTLFHLTRQDDQVQCFENAARHLRRDGAFVLETFYPDPAKFPRDQMVRVKAIEVDRVRVEFATLDRVNQRVTSQNVVFQGKGVTLYPNQMRFAWPSEMDLMARLAGLRLAARYGGWDRRPFEADASSLYISVYRRAAARDRRR